MDWPRLVVITVLAMFVCVAINHGVTVSRTVAASEAAKKSTVVAPAHVYDVSIEGTVMDVDRMPESSLTFYVTYRDRSGVVVTRTFNSKSEHKIAIKDDNTTSGL